MNFKFNMNDLDRENNIDPSVILGFDESPTTKMLERLPICFDWVEFKGETVIAHINYKATEKAKKPMLDISYCMTKALNGSVLKTVQWDRRKFKPSRLGYTKW